MVERKKMQSHFIITAKSSRGLPSIREETDSGAVISCRNFLASYDNKMTLKSIPYLNCLLLFVTAGPHELAVALISTFLLPQYFLLKL
jgi:hypothetical protein